MYLISTAKGQFAELWPKFKFYEIKKNKQKSEFCYLKLVKTCYFALGRWS